MDAILASGGRSNAMVGILNILSDVFHKKLQILTNSRLESHPFCKNCMRLNLKCTYKKVFRFDEESLSNGKTFGKSNQFKNKKLAIIYANSADVTRTDKNLSSESFTNMTFLPTTLSQRLLNKDLNWAPIQNRKTYFVNNTASDFTDPCETFDMQTENWSNIGVLQELQISENDLSLSVEGFLDYDRDITFFSPVFDCATRLLEIENDIDQAIHSKFGVVSSTPFQPIPNFLSCFNFTRDNLNLSINKYFDKFCTLPPTQQTLVSYFIEKICPLSISYSKPVTSQLNINPIYFNEILHNKNIHRFNRNPFLYLITPLALENDVVLRSLLSTSAHYLTMAGDSRFKEYSEVNSNFAFKKLPVLIQEKLLTKDANWDDILAVILLLCLQELSKSLKDTNKWRLYLGYARFIIKRINSLNSFTTLGNFFARYFITNEVIGNTTNKDPQIFNEKAERKHLSLESTINIKERNPFVQFILFDGQDGDLYLNTLKDRDCNINLAFGCCPYLICLIHQISCLGECCEGLNMEDISIKKRFDRYILDVRKKIKIDIENIDQKIDPMEIIDEEYEKIVYNIAEIKRLTNLIYLFLRVDLELFYLNGGLHSKCFLNNLKEMELVKKRVKKLYGGLPHVSNKLLWPLFILGILSSNLNFENDRWFILDEFEKMENLEICPSLAVAKDAIISIWKGVDSGLLTFRWKDLIKDKFEILSITLIN